MGMPPAFSCSPFLISRLRVHSSSSATLPSFSLLLLCSRGSVVDVYVYVLRGDQVVLSEVPSLVIQRGIRSLLLFSPSSSPPSDCVLASFRLSALPSVCRRDI